MFCYKCYNKWRTPFVAIAQVVLVLVQIIQRQKSQYYILFARTLAARCTAQPISSANATQLFQNGKRSKNRPWQYDAYFVPFGTFSQQTNENLYTLSSNLAHIARHFFFSFLSICAHKRRIIWNLFESLLKLKLFAHMWTKNEENGLRWRARGTQSAVVVKQHGRTSTISSASIRIIQLFDCLLDGIRMSTFTLLNAKCERTSYMSI